MKKTALSLITAALSLALFAPPLFAQVLHVNDEWESCAMVIDPSLTQESWHQFVSEVGLVTYFRPLASARPLGAKNFEFCGRSPSWSRPETIGRRARTVRCAGRLLGSIAQGGEAWV